jgi:hypothetical protein
VVFVSENSYPERGSSDPDDAVLRGLRAPQTWKRRSRRRHIDSTVETAISETTPDAAEPYLAICRPIPDSPVL